MNIEFSYEEWPENRLPIASDDCGIPGARIRCARQLDTDAYKNVWEVEAEDFDELSEVFGHRWFTILEPRSKGTDYRVMVGETRKVWL